MRWSKTNVRAYTPHSFARGLTKFPYLAIVAKGRAAAAKTKTKAVSGAETDAVSDRDAVSLKKDAKAPKNGSRYSRRSVVTAKSLNPLASDSEPLTELDTDPNDLQEDVLSRTKKTLTSPDPPVSSKPRPKPRFEPNEHQPEDVRTPTPTSPPATNMRARENGTRPPNNDPAREDGRDEDEAQGNASENGEETEAGSSRLSPAPSSQTRTRRPQKRQASPAASEASLADFTSRKRIRR